MIGLAHERNEGDDMTAPNYDDWTTEKDDTDVHGEHVVMLTATFGKGKSAVTYRRFFRNGSYCGYAAHAADAEENWARVKDGETWMDGEWVVPAVSKRHPSETTHGYRSWSPEERGEYDAMYDR